MLKYSAEADVVSVVLTQKKTQKKTTRLIINAHWKKNL